jgi:hypothetical protein
VLAVIFGLSKIHLKRDHPRERLDLGFVAFYVRRVLAREKLLHPGLVMRRQVFTMSRELSGMPARRFTSDAESTSTAE